MRTRRQGFMVWVVTGSAVGLALCWSGTGAAVRSAVAATKAEWCEATKLTAAGHKASCLAIEEAKGVLGGTPNPARCSGPFEKAFAKAEAKAGAGVCPTEGDTAAIEAQVDACIGDIAAALSGSPPPSPCSQFPATGQTTAYTADKNDGIGGAVAVPDDGTVKAGATLSYQDNGDGTITDLNTGLMWEKKDDAGGLHDKDNAYRWSDDGSQETIWDWLDDVNTEGGTGFAGRNDWRIPNVKELQSIINYENVNPAVSSEFNTVCAVSCTVLTCSCTKTFVYWSSSTSRESFSAWSVYFSSGRVSDVDFSKGSTLNVRAVRGGL